MSGELDQVYTFYLGTDATSVWKALTDPEITAQWFHGLAVASEWRKDASIHWTQPGSDRAVVFGTIESVTTGEDLVHSFRLAAHDDPETRVRIRLTNEDRGVCRLVLTHVGFEERNETWHHAAAGWPRALSALKTKLETGKVLGGR